MIDWQDYQYTMVVTERDGNIKEINSDNLIFLIDLGSAGLETGLYTSATIYQNQLSFSCAS